MMNDRDRREFTAMQREVAEVLHRLESQPAREETAGIRVPRETLRPGDRVTVHGIDTPGEVLTAPDQRQMVDLQVGSVRMRVHVDHIKGKDRTQPTPRQRVVISQGAAARAQVGPELWVHGMRAQQAIEAVKEYIEKAALAGHTRVRIIHGKGRGILRTAIHNALGDHPLVGTFRDAIPAEGGSGVTIVEL